VRRLEGFGCWKALYGQSFGVNAAESGGEIGWKFISLPHDIPDALGVENGWNGDCVPDAGSKSKKEVSLVFKGSRVAPRDLYLSVCCGSMVRIELPKLFLAMFRHEDWANILAGPCGLEEM